LDPRSLNTSQRRSDIADHEHTSAPRRDLEQLSGDAGAKLLRALGVRGADDELRASSEEFRGHCLGLTLLGSYLSDAYDGDIRCRQEVSQRLSHDVRQGVQAPKVMESYQTWFGEGPELSLLRMLGLFDRPADEMVIGALLNPPPIPGITESLTGLSPVEWRIILAKLRRTRLLAGEDPYHRGYLDTHPLVREFFGNQLRCQRPAAWQECNRRLYHHYRTLTSDRPDSFREMEPLFLAAINGCQAGFFRDVLNQVYIPQIQRGNASFAAKALGARGALLSVLGHFFEDGRWGSLRETTVEGQSLTAEDQVFLLIEAGLHLTISRGLGAPEAQVCYRRAEPLCRSLDRPLLLHLALTGQWRYSFMTERLSATMRIAQRVYSLAQEQNDSALLVGAHRALTFTFYFMGDFKNAREHATRGVQIWDSKSGQARIVEVNEPGVSCLIFQAMSNWHFGEFASCRAAMAQAVFLAKELNDMHGLAVALIFEGILAHLAGDCAEVERLATEVIAMSTRQNFAMWMAAGTVLRGWARSALGDTALGISLIDEGIDDFRKTGSILMVPYCLARKAEALHLAERTSDALETIEEAEALVERSEERWWGAELQRLRGVFLRVLRANQSQVELSFRTAIRIAREQNSTSLTARAEASYAGPRSG
jgi:predicted ATPase